MRYCPRNQSLSTPWEAGGLTDCFIDTVTSAAVCGVALVFGTVQLIFYRRYATPIDARLRPRSHLFRGQVVAMVLYILLLVVRFALQAQFLYQRTLFGYQVTNLLCKSAAWAMALALLMVERTRILPSIPSRGHGLVLLVHWTLAFVSENLPFASINSPLWWWRMHAAKNIASDRAEFGLWLLRYLAVFYTFVVGFKAPGLPNYHQWYTLLQEAGGDAEAGRAGAGESQSTWSGIRRKLKMIGPYVWPRGQYCLQFRVFICFCILGVGRAVNVLQPIYNKYIVDSLTVATASGVPPANATITRTLYLREANVQVGLYILHGLFFRWDLILVWVLLRSLQGIGVGGSGLLNCLRSFLWIRVSQYTTKEMSLRLFAHLHGLSLRWHLSKKTGEVLRVMDRGTNSINGILSYLVFSIAPVIVDIIIGIIYFAAKFNIYFSLIVLVTMVFYVAATIRVTEWRTKYRRNMNVQENKMNAMAVDSLLNFETVKYYGAEEHEVKQYRGAIDTYMDAEWLSMATLNLLNTVQNMLINGGFLAGTLLCAYYIFAGEYNLTVGDFVLFSSYIVQLYGPLNFLGTYYRTIQQNFIDMENMFELLDENKDVEDDPNAKQLRMGKGEVTFDNVHFHYTPERAVLKGVSFHIPAGQTFALVGHSGSGKSTIVRLLFRFYDINEGRILIDNQNISKVKQNSLRQAIGVVPQDTVLFNTDIRKNILYGRPDASDEELEAAAAAADIHDRICSFPDGYDTLVGERGLKLSGGEKQRVAIARTLLKAPKIVLLDEATSALDTKTERNIQASLSRMCVGRTTLVVAHRLSTIIDADQILVMREGEIVERGSHNELLAKGELYASLWEEQQRQVNEEDTSEGYDSQAMSSDASRG